MQETFDFYTLIIIVTFLGALLLLAFFINKKKDFFKSQITLLIINSLLSRMSIKIAAGVKKCEKSV